MNNLYCDFETRSPVNLKKEGLKKYVEDPRTEVVCIGFSAGGEVFSLPNMGGTSGVHCLETFVAHNAVFDYLVYNNVYVKKTIANPLQLGQLKCTAAKCLAAGLPAKLADAARELGLKNQKDPRGERAIKRLSSPKSLDPLLYNEDPETLAIMREYCKQDVRTMMELDQKLPDLIPAEQELYLLDLIINQRGLQFNRDLVEKSLALIEKEKERLNLDCAKLTGGAVTALTQVAKIKDWALKSQGVSLETLGANAIKELALNGPVGELIALRQQFAKSSTAKLEAMLDLGYKDVLYFTLQYHAAHTGRWGGRGVQIQNFPRQNMEPGDVKAVHAGIENAQIERPIEAVSKILRSYIVPTPGYYFWDLDFSNIEARIVADLAGQNDIREAFRAQDNQTGPEVYETEAAKVYGIKVSEVTPEKRNVGKVCTLAFGYQGGFNSFVKMATTYKVELLGHRFSLEDKEDFKTRFQEIKSKTRPAWKLGVDTFVEVWRAKNSKIVAYWGLLDSTAKRAIQMPGIPHWLQMNGVKVGFKFDKIWLRMILPSGRSISYFKARLVKDKRGQAIEYWGKETGTKNYVWVSLYGGKLLENLSQAIARDILAETMKRIHAQLGQPGCPSLAIVSTVHDEILLEVDDLISFEEADRIIKPLAEQSPTWMKNLPIAVEAWHGGFFR